MATFKSYSEKSKARRALVQVYNIDKDGTEQFLTQVDAKWGFHLDDEGKLAALQVGEPGDEAVVTLPAAAEPAAAEPAAELVEDDTSASPSASAFGAFALSQLTAPSNAAPAEAPRAPVAQRTEGLKIEKDREQRNGVKMPSKGGLCRTVWDTLNSMMTHDEATGLANVPTAADIKHVAEQQGWNVNNASIEYYQWRKFMGISGRGKKQI